jgi:16S rRNA processing protein RimM
MSDLVCLGVIIATHGVKGRVKIKTYTENPKDLVSYGELRDESGKIYNITITGVQPANLLASIENINSMEAAEQLKGVELFAKRQNMPEPEAGSYYFHDLKELQIRLKDGTIYGNVYSVQDYGAGIILEIRKTDGVEESYSFNKETFPKIDIENGYAEFDPPEIIEVHP